MPILKTFPVFGELVQVHSISHGNIGLNAATQTCPPGGGPPPHFHSNEDEFFIPVEGEFEMFNGETWIPLTKEGHFAPRGKVHGFRNSGQTEGKIMFVASPGPFLTYLELISTLTLPQDMQRLVDISAEYGITFAIPSIPEPSSASSSGPVAEPVLA